MDSTEDTNLQVQEAWCISKDAHSYGEIHILGFA